MVFEAQTAPTGPAISAREAITLDRYCSWEGLAIPKKKKEIHLFRPTPEAEFAVKEIAKVTGLRANFVVHAATVDNAVARAKPMSGSEPKPDNVAVGKPPTQSEPMPSSKPLRAPSRSPNRNRRLRLVSEASAPVPWGT